MDLQTILQRWLHLKSARQSLMPARRAVQAANVEMASANRFDLQQDLPNAQSSKLHIRVLSN
jgi:hypothetical protein